MAAKDLSAILDIAAVLGIPIAEEYRDGVVRNYERLLEQAALVMAVPPASSHVAETANDGGEFVP